MFYVSKKGATTTVYCCYCEFRNRQQIGQRSISIGLEMCHFFLLPFQCEFSVIVRDDFAGITHITNESFVACLTLPMEWLILYFVNDTQFGCHTTMSHTAYHQTTAIRQQFQPAKSIQYNSNQCELGRRILI